MIKVAVAALALSQHCPAIAATVPTLTNFAAYSLPDGRVQVSWVSDVPVPTGILEAHDGSSFRKVAGSPERHVRNHRVTVEGWRPGAHVRIRVRAEARAGSEFVSAPVELELPQVPRRSAREQTIPLNLASRPLAERVIVAAVPLPPGQLWQPEEAWAETGGAPLPSQARVSSRWPDGSVRWLSAGLLVPADAANLRFRIGEPTESATNPFEIRESPEELIIGNGLLRLRFAKGGFALFEEVSHADGLNRAGTPRAGNIQMTDGEGVVFGLGLPDRLELEERGPVQAVVLAEGPFQNQSGANWFRYRIRWFLAAHSPLVRVQVTFINDVMQPEFQRLTSATILLPLAGAGVLRGQLAGARTHDIMQPGRNAIQQVTDHRLRRVEEGRARQRDERSPGWVVAERGAARLALVLRDFWQTWPKGLALNPEGIQLNVLPALAETEYVAGDLHDWLKHYYWFSRGKYLFKRGMALRVEFNVRFGKTSEPCPADGWDAWAEALETLPYAAPSPEFCCASGAFGPLLPASATRHRAYDALVERAVRAMARGHEEAGEYGWMNFGDWYGERQFNWGNNEYDWPWAMAVHFARSGRWDYLASGERMVRHSSTIDAVRVPWTTNMAGRSYIHCVGHVGLGSEPPTFATDDPAWERFRTGSGGFIKGGIDTGGHIFEEGKFALFLLTGDRDVLEAAALSAGAQAAYLTPQFDFRIERAAGWPLINAVAAYEASANPFYLNAARLFVERILKKQDAQHGGWMLPQDPKECSHPPPHLGGKPFATGVLLYGLMRYDLIEPRPDVKRALVRACEWLVERAWNREKGGFRYKTGCPDYADSADAGGSSALCSAALAYGWKLTGDQRFAEVLATSFATVCARDGNLGKGNAMLIRQSAFALPALQEIEQRGGSNQRPPLQQP